MAFQETANASGAQVFGRTVLIPRSALQQQDGREVVFVLAGDRVERRAVTVAGSAGDEVMVSAGLSRSEKVILELPRGLGDGSTAREKK